MNKFLEIDMEERESAYLRGCRWVAETLPGFDAVITEIAAMGAREFAKHGSHERLYVWARKKFEGRVASLERLVTTASESDRRAGDVLLASARERFLEKVKVALAINGHRVEEPSPVLKAV